MDTSQLQLIIEYGMSREEGFAFRLAMLYLELAKRYFPDYKHVGFPRKGDPRKSELFKYCWKLAEETKNKLRLEDYRPYVQAQLTVLKNIQVGDYHPLIHPRCLVGGQAWKRWHLWQAHFLEAKKTAVAAKVTDRTPEIKQALKDTKHLLQLRLKDLTAERLREAMDSKFLFRLVRLGGISPYFLALSSTVRDYARENGVELQDLPDEVSDDVRACYDELFGGL